MSHPLPDMTDLIFRNAELIDGSGGERRRADLAVQGDRIVAIGELGGLRARQEIDARGRVLAPGFIDVHGHDDLMFVERPDLRWKTSQGITTVIVGNCGVSGAPAPRPGNTAAALALLGETPLFAGMAPFLAELERRRPMINVAALVGHANLRLACMDDPLAAPTAQEQAAMENLLEESLRAGAVGFSTGLAYEPGGRAGLAELQGLARVAARHRALHTSHIRNEGDAVEQAVREVLEIGRASGCATVLSHHKCMMPANWGKSRNTLADIDRARADGLEVGLDMYPYPGSSTILIPERAELIERIRVTWSQPHPECSGRDLDDIAREWGCDKTTAARRLLPAGAIYFAMDEAEVQRIFQHPGCMVGSDGLPNDAHPHPRLWGSFTRVLGRFVREAGLMTLEAAIARMTSLPARVYGLQDRGRLGVGAHADLVLFDPASVVDQATWEQPTLPSIGIEGVWVNGASVFPDAAAARPGRVLRSA
ncbi:N-acyl-D-amino-acid deacylase family protein [Bordetella trematum]|uniref:N-acyl-D-amino-acid deacylase family protein n=1 Tax=Bordetella trematum TaxID=123899 RepID=UPI003D0CD156